MIKKVLSIFLAICMLFPFTITLSGCSGKSPFEKGTNIRQNIDSNKDYTVGSVSKTGWHMEISKGTFNEKTELIMNVMSSADSKSYESGGFTFVGTPVELKIAGKENVRLNQPIRVTLQIPKEHLENPAIDEMFYGYYYNGKWDYYLPDSIDLQKGTAAFNVYHFSYLGFGKPSNEEQIKTFAKTMATKQWENESKKQDYQVKTDKQFDDLFSQMGIKSKALRNKLAADVISYIDPSDLGYFDYMAQSTNSALNGQEGKLEFENKYKELLGKAIYQALEKEPSSFADKVNIVGNLASAAGSIAGGDSKAALESIANMLNGMVPASQLAASTSAYIAAKAEEAIDYWAASEIEKAYQVYSTGIGGKWGYEDGLKGDFGTIFTLLGGGERQMEINIIRKYCERWGKNESELTEAKKNEIISNAKRALKTSFDKRKTDEPKIQKKIQNEEAFIAELKKQGLISPSNNQKYFGLDKSGANFDIAARLNRLYNIKASIISMMDKDKADTINAEFLAKAISQWIYWNEKGDRNGFYKYMREMGYIKDPIPMDKFAWVLTEVLVDEDAKGLEADNKSFKGIYETTINASPGSIISKWTYVGKTDTYYNPPKKNGETATSIVKFSTPPSKIQSGEKVNILVSASLNDQNLSFFDSKAHGRVDLQNVNSKGELAGGYTRFSNEKGKNFIEANKNNRYTDEATVSIEMPAGRSEGTKICIQQSGGGKWTAKINYMYEWKSIP